MKELISSYSKSCDMAKERIGELTKLRDFLGDSGNSAEVERLDLDRRIRLLYTEYYQMREIISHLTAYVNYVGSR